MATGITLSQILDLEPRLKDIADAAVMKSKATQNPWPVYGRAKAAADELVGWSAKSRELKTSTAYDCFIDYLLDRMEL